MLCMEGGESMVRPLCCVWEGERAWVALMLCMEGGESMGRPLGCVWKGERAWVDPYVVYGRD